MDTGVFVPFSKQDASSRVWWANWSNFWGGVLFCMGGVWGWFYGKIPLWEARQ
jgi:hypothetical protein